jgi:hypothetical protein
LRGKGLQGITDEKVESGLVLKLLPQEGDQALIYLKGFDLMAGGEEGAGEGTETGADLLHRLVGGWSDGLGDLGG